MNKHTHDKDTISEQEYTLQMGENSTEPEDDSPGDSETDAGTEFLLGMSYEGDPLSEEEESEFPLDHPVRVVADTATVISSDQPSPWQDIDSVSNTH